MWSLGLVIPKLLPILLASSSHPRKPQDLARNFEQLYRDLERPGAIHRQVTPTLRFSHVSPPTANGTSTWKLQDAKNRFSEVVNEAVRSGPQIVTRRGKETAVVLSMESYLEHALNQYKSGKRKNAVMAAQAAIIAEEDVARLARYFASLDGLATVKPE